MGRLTVGRPLEVAGDKSSVWTDSAAGQGRKTAGQHEAKGPRRATEALHVGQRTLESTSFMVASTARKDASRT